MKANKKPRVLKKPLIAFFFFLLFVTAILLIFFKIDRNCNVENYKGEVAEPINIRLVALCTPNYLTVGEKGIEGLRDYCDKNDYEFKLFDKQLVKDLHINFTKMKIMEEELKKDDVDYTIISDVDVTVHDDAIKLEKIIEKHMKEGHVLAMPEDFISRCFKFSNKTWLKYRRGGLNLFNAGFIIGKNGKEASEIMGDWLSMARNECKKEANTKPRNQNVFDTCVYPKHKEKIATIPYQLHGLGCSAGIRQDLGFDGNPVESIKNFVKKKKALRNGGHERQEAAV